MQIVRNLVSILYYDVNEKRRILRHSPDGLTRESSLVAMTRLGEFARELEGFRIAMRELGAEPPVAARRLDKP